MLIYKLGKTYLASVLIEACLKQTDYTTCYFYCNDKADSRASARVILRSILMQMVHQHTELVPYCYAKMKTSLSSVLLDLSTINTLLETFCERIPHLFVVVDGLDECGEEQRDILETFRKLVRNSDVHSPGKIRVAFLSRPSPEIKKFLPEAQVFALNPETTKLDIQKYCEYRAREFVKFDYGENDLADAIGRIGVKANGKHC